MRLRFSPPILLLLLVLASSPALASFGGSKPETRPDQAPSDLNPSATTPRQEAERLYGDAYDEVAKAKKDLADDKQKNAQKKFKKALDRGQRAVELDSTYYEAWNLVGFCARHLADYDRSLAAYARCLRIKPEYAPAREYLGEAYVELGQPAKAREQLAWLERLKATDEFAGLKARIDAWAAAHPDSAAATGASRSDSTAARAATGVDSSAATHTASRSDSAAATRAVPRDSAAVSPPGASKP